MSQRFPQMKDEMQWVAVQDAGPRAVERFEQMLVNGESINTAAMLATQKSPSGGINDQIVTRNAGSVEHQFKGCEEMLGLYRKNYKAATGEELPADAVVNRGLAAYPGDPGCIVTHKHTLDDVKKTMQKRNCQVEGDWENHPVQQAPTPQSVRINETSMNRLLEDYQSNPDYEKATVDELKEEIIAKHTKVVTPEEAMAAPRTLDEVHRRVYH